MTFVTQQADSGSPASGRHSSDILQEPNKIGEVLDNSFFNFFYLLIFQKNNHFASKHLQ